MALENLPTPHQDKVTRKVILLYIMEILDSLTYQELLQTALESMYMDFFQFSSLISELETEKLVLISERKEDPNPSLKGKKPVRYSLTPAGTKVLDTLRKQIPVPVTAYLQKALRDRDKNLRKEQSIRADWEIRPDGEYEVSLSLFEGQTRYFRCLLTVPDMKTAIALCANWEQNAGELYPQVLPLLWPKPGE